ncbi:hypothetical protein MTO96_038681 [Rhipicephalus appendiculatus]
MRAAPWPGVRNLHAVHVRAPPRRSWSDIDSRSFPGTSLPCEKLNTRVVTFRAAALANGRGPSNCESKLHNCTDLVKPFLNDLRYMFPNHHRGRRRHVQEIPSTPVHAICSSERYQKEYLQNASCFRKVSVDNCGVFYTAMVDQVTNPASRHDHICCSYSQFKSCVSEPLLRLCGNRARTIMDHSMAFLIDRCGKSYYSLSYKCPPGSGPAACEQRGLSESHSLVRGVYGRFRTGHEHASPQEVRRLDHHLVSAHGCLHAQAYAQQSGPDECDTTESLASSGQPGMRRRTNNASEGQG